MRVPCPKSGADSTVTLPGRARSSAQLRDCSSGGAGNARTTRGEVGITRSRAEARDD
jgi:hypothetical protein